MTCDLNTSYVVMDAHVLRAACTGWMIDRDNQVMAIKEKSIEQAMNRPWYCFPPKTREKAIKRLREDHMQDYMFASYYKGNSLRIVKEVLSAAIHCKDHRVLVSGQAISIIADYLYLGEDK